MRLTPLEHQTLKQAALDSFGPSAVVRLFGSRVVDEQRGGDIDLLIETPLQDTALIAQAHTHFLGRVYTVLGEQKVDVLVDHPARKHRPPIFSIAYQNGVVL